jgi:hypothetical protein
MRTVMAVLITAVATASAGAVWAQAQAQAQVIRLHENIKEATIVGHWEYPNSFAGTTFVDLFANQPGPGSTSRPTLSFSIISTDANGFVVLGFVDFETSTMSLTESTDLSTARLQATGLAFDLLSSAVVPLNIDLTFSATGELLDTRSNFHFIEPGTVIDSHFDGQSRDAVATGTFLVNGTNYTPVPSQLAQLLFNCTGAFFLQIVLPQH